MTPYSRRPHDLGGLNDGLINQSDHSQEPWEKRVDSIMRLLSDNKRSILSVDELRRGIEDLGPGVYENLTYYERWITSLTNLLIEKGIISIEELGHKMSEINTRSDKNSNNLKDK